MKEESTVLAENWLDETLKASGIGKKARSKENPDLITLYRAKCWLIEVKEIKAIKKDDKKVYFKSGFPEDLINRYQAYFETEKEAIDWLFEHEKNEIKMAEKEIKSAQKRLKKLNERYNKTA